LPCATNCGKCWGPTMKECVLCNKPYVTLLVRELPRPVFSCVEKCPLCYFKEEHGYGALNRTGEEEHTATEEIVPMPVEQDEMVAIHKLTDGADAKDPVDANQTALIGEEMDYPNRDLTDKGKASSCSRKVTKMKAEIKGWDSDCLWPVKKANTACKNRVKLAKTLNSVKKAVNLVKGATGTGIQTTLNGLQFIPWGIGKGLKAISKVAGVINGKAAKVKILVDKAYSTVNHARLKTACTKIKKIHKQVKRKIKISNKLLSRFSGKCGCDCLVPENQMNAVIAKSKSARSVCTQLPSFDLNPGVEINLPSWVEDVLNFIKSISDGLSSILNYRYCIYYFFGSSCFSVGDIIRSITWLLGVITDLVEGVVFGLLAAIGIDLGCNTIESCITKYIDKYLNMIPGLNYQPPGLPNVYSPSLTINIDPDMDLISLAGCVSAAFKAVMMGKYYRSGCDMEELDGGNAPYIKILMQYGWISSNQDVTVYDVMAVCPAC